MDQMRINHIRQAMAVLLLAVPVILTLSGCVPVDDHRELALAYQEIQEGRYVDAEIRTELCLRNDSRNADALMLHSFCQLQNPSGVLGQSKALFNLKKAVNLVPDRFDAWYFLGWGQMKCEKYRDALASFEHALKLLPQNSPYREKLLVNIVSCCLENNLYSKGFSYLQPLRRCSRYRKDPALYNVMALLALKRGDEQQAVSSFVQALQLDPDNTAVLQNIAVFFDLYKANARVAKDYYIRTMIALKGSDARLQNAIQNRIRYLASVPSAESSEKK